MQLGDPDSGYIDLLYRTEAGWALVDFKTDARALLRIEPKVLLYFLDYDGRVRLYEV